MSPPRLHHDKQQESHQEESDLLFLEGGRFMQEALTNDRVHIEPYHSGLWWREVLRGSATILFALLMF